MKLESISDYIQLYNIFQQLKNITENIENSRKLNKLASVVLQPEEPSTSNESVISTTDDLHMPLSSTVPMSAQNDRANAIRVECTKPRVVYSQVKTNQRKEMCLAAALSEYEYSCG